MLKYNGKRFTGKISVLYIMNNTTTTEEWILLALRLQFSTRLMNFLLIPIIIVFGSFGNMLIIVIKLKHRNRNQTAVYKDSQFLMFSLAIVDQTVLFSVFFYWLFGDLGQLNLITSSYGRLLICRIGLFNIRYSLQLSSLGTALLSIERSITLLNVQNGSKSHRSKFIAIYVVGFLLAISTHFHLFWTVSFINLGKRYQTCGAILPKHFDRIYYWVDCVLCSIIPCGTVIVCNFRIVGFLMTRSSQVAPNQPQSLSLLIAQRSQNRITKVLMIITLLFVLFNAPFRVLRLFTDIDFKKSMTTLKGMVKVLLYNLTANLWMINSAVNFYCYLFSSQFRRQLKFLFKPRIGNIGEPGVI